MAEFAQQANEITTTLGLGRPPVALAFVQEAPSLVPQVSRVSPSSCGFWPLAESSVFYASAEQHHQCQIGAMVMGFELPDPVMEQIGGLVNAMCGCSYLSPDEGDKIPGVPGSKSGIVYGPLAEFPQQPDAVLMWLTPAQAMIYHEAAGSASWASEPVRTTGRPACAAIPSAMNDGRAVLSLGCKGMRTFTEVPDDSMLAVIPGGGIDGFVESLRVTVAANNEMAQYYNQRKAEVAALDAAAAQA
ncbi:hypothetical protein Rhe02_15310 [Rhizocola hellebori]|uniref:Uncharacterized protein n=1 Tax=Rhizocola hellebori TaxID=1392758 RepID=A0A8J3Q472_9ACTN|nr:DUF169 domain-containing protein [Rhizocola hellebori]GIH03464.1 hypothetical protein Rhe02_15310 [Rhizocola hellebori]